ncbi:SusD/RagB family nutrient-binding outer membrane lipoprotein [Persicobacter psychrovividus]|uniref:SusD/RagB family nutrient-binding outer membrane lipoprotein n=1 Tax=Persicobacter psychrovividus TaxID=387638 RepID=A0ABN6L5L3_9BACT|nr:hypothetical protein PEPS_05460 [Persicobacter psychrovividus]
MKLFNKIVLGVGVLGTLATGCTQGFEEANTNNNAPEVVPTYSLMYGGTRAIVDELRDEWMFSGRGVNSWVQYWAQRNYTEEDRFQYRENNNNSSWKRIYTSLNDIQRVIEIAQDPELSGSYALAYGDPDNQAAAAMILKAWTFQILADSYGAVPYHTTGAENADFQALNIAMYPAPKYVSAEEIYPDLLNELKAAAEMIDTSKPVFTERDYIFGGNAEAWKRFANSLRVRVAVRMRAKDQTLADKHITEAVASGVMESNDHTAAYTYDAFALKGAPKYGAFFVSNRTDFAVANSFVDLLKGLDVKPDGTTPMNNPFAGLVDPRLQKFASPVGTTTEAIKAGIVPELDDLSKYVGQPYGLDNGIASEVSPFTSLPSQGVLKVDFSEVLMEYAELCFLLSEVNNWDQMYYEKGVRASMERWGVEETKIDAYVAALPAASMETVLTQKYIALYLQPAEAWAEYRRTGYPMTIIMPGDVTYVNEDGESFEFEPLVPDLTEMPARLNFSQEEFLLNEDGYKAGVSVLGGNSLDTKVWWMP